MESHAVGMAFMIDDDKESELIYNIDKLEFMEAIQWGYLTDLKNQTQQKKY